MKYRYLGYYNDNADIKDIIDSIGWGKPNATANYYAGGFGNFHISDSEDVLNENDADGKRFLLSDDKKYIMGFTDGKKLLLTKGMDKNEEEVLNAGYYIDIWVADEKLPVFTDEELEELTERRRKENKMIKDVIRDEFKSVFKKAGEGLDFSEYAPDCVVGSLDETGEILKMMLVEDDGELLIKVELCQEYEDVWEDFESRYFGCDDWPQLLLNVREGIKGGWFIENDEDEEDA